MIVDRTVELQWFDLRSLRCVPPREQLRHGGRPHRRGSIDILHPCKRSCIPSYHRDSIKIPAARLEILHTPILATFLGGVESPHIPPPPGSLAVLQGFHQNPCSTARDFGVPIWGTPAPPSEIDDFPGVPLLGPPGPASDFNGAGTPHRKSNVELYPICKRCSADPLKPRVR